MDNCILSNLVEIQKSLNNSDVMALRDQASKQLSILTDRTTKLWPYLHKDGKYSDNLLNLSIVYDKLFNDFDELIYTKSLIDTEAAETVVVLEKEYFMNSYRQYEDNTDSPDYILERLNDYSLFTDKDDNATLEGRINFHSSWKYPGMHIRPGLGEMTPHMIAFDPLYMVDEDEELFSIIRNQFTKEYQSRIRYKYINEDSEYMFSNIPKCQINFILITDFFNYKPFEVIKRYLTEIYNDVLCDGGSVIFTYNDCDNTAAIINAENNMNSYTPQRLIIPFIEYIGYAHIKSFTSLNLSWVEIKKEGNKKSLRGGQCLAKTINNNIDKI